MKHFLTLLFLLFTFTGFSQKWKHVYDNYRLKVLKDSVQITGVVKNCYQYIDGDYVIELKLDSCFYLLNKNNYKKLKGLLEVEIICQHSNVFAECFGYLNELEVPEIGQRVRVIGKWVYDRRHYWNEIHPVEFIEIIK